MQSNISNSISWSPVACTMFLTRPWDGSIFAFISIKTCLQNKIATLNILRPCFYHTGLYSGSLLGFQIHLIWYTHCILNIYVMWWKSSFRKLKCVHSCSITFVVKNPMYRIVAFYIAHMTNQHMYMYTKKPGDTSSYPYYICL